jgi:hypothetical protein
MTMVHSPLRYAALVLITAASLATSACLTTIDEACSTIADDHCASCYACAAEVDGVSGAELCDVPASAGASLANCKDHLAGLCEQEARTMQDPFGDLETCEQAVGEETCDELVEREALDQASPPPACLPFL